jgi:hypothetical protein
VSDLPQMPAGDAGADLWGSRRNASTEYFLDLPWRNGDPWWSDLVDDESSDDVNSTRDSSDERVLSFRKARLFVGLVALCLALAIWVTLVLEPSSDATRSPDGPILVIGDSLVVQATKALRSWNLPSVPIIARGGLGSAPCDWENGYTDPLSGHYLKFSDVFRGSKPVAVVFAFTGNPGLESKSTGCIDSSGRYSLSALLTNYKRALTKMSLYASEHGTQVYLAAVPPRNPATPPGLYRGSGGTHQYGFNGVPAFNRLYREMARSATGLQFHWTYDPYPAEYVSTSALSWRLDERCMPWDSGDCTRGVVRVRAGGLDAIHLDTEGAGAILYAIGLAELPLEQIGVGCGSSALSGHEMAAAVNGARHERGCIGCQ